jgi:hypothetical protein
MSSLFRRNSGRLRLGAQKFRSLLVPGKGTAPRRESS